MLGRLTQNPAARSAEAESVPGAWWPGLSADPSQVRSCLPKRYAEILTSASQKAATFGNRLVADVVSSCDWCPERKRRRDKEWRHREQATIDTGRDWVRLEVPIDEPRAVESRPSWRRQKGTAPRTLGKQGPLILDFWPQNHEGIRFRCFKPPGCRTLLQ